MRRVSSENLNPSSDPANDLLSIKNEMNMLQKKVTSVLDKNTHLEFQLNTTCEALREEVEMRHLGEKHCEALKSTLKDINEQKISVETELADKIKKLSFVSTRNVNIRAHRQKEKNEALQTSLLEQTEKTNLLESECEILNKKLEEALKAGVKSRKSVAYWKGAKTKTKLKIKMLDNLSHMCLI